MRKHFSFFQANNWYHINVEKYVQKKFCLTSPLFLLFLARIIKQWKQKEIDVIIIWQIHLRRVSAERFISAPLLQNSVVYYNKLFLLMWNVLGASNITLRNIKCVAEDRIDFFISVSSRCSGAPGHYRYHRHCAAMLSSPFFQTFTCILWLDISNYYSA